MLNNFEEITAELNDDEMGMLPIIVEAFKQYTKEKPIKTPLIISSFNSNREKFKIKAKLTGPRLRKICNHIRTNGIIPLIGTSEGYYVSYDTEVVLSQIQSLKQRANSINRCAEGLYKFLSDWIAIKSTSDLPSDEYSGKVEFKIRGEKKIRIGYYEEVYKTFEDDNAIAGWDEVEGYKYI